MAPDFRGRWRRAALVLLIPGLAGAETPYSAPAGSEGYVGSRSCRECHERVYDRWAATRHSFSVLSAEEARHAGYPRPPRSAPGVGSADWDELGHTIGGRQRIAYATSDGRILAASYHHRTGSWRPFPETRFEDCEPCHATGPIPVSAGASHGGAPAGIRWNEPNIGCESCHGPGEAHLDSTDRADIRVDVSSRLCGTCHTAAGRVLPHDDRHDTHDLVQHWNADRHTTGVGRHSHNRHCATCHSPTEGLFGDRELASTQRVFSDEKHSITCIGCHDPHELSHPDYRRDVATLDAPRPPKLQTWSGDDGRMERPNYRKHASAEAVCRACHKGADRIELDHGGATCTDCHNPFGRNRTPESRVFHDANHTRLSCRPCHADADHKISILFGDPDFLSPRSVHDLRSLPKRVVARYGFRAPGLAVGSHRVADGAERRRRPAIPPGWDPAAYPGREPVSPDEPAPREVATLLAEARAHAARGEDAAALALLEEAVDTPATSLLVELPLDGEAPASLPADPAVLLGVVGAEEAPLRSWLQGLFDMQRGDFTSAAARMRSVWTAQPERPGASFGLGLAELGRGWHAPAETALRRALELEPAHTGARAALGVAYLRQGRDDLARYELEQAVEERPGDAVAAYLLGRAQLASGHTVGALHSLRAAIENDPALLDARFALARTERGTGYETEAIATYNGIIERDPGNHQAHRELALVYKYLADQIDFALRAQTESAPRGRSERAWRAQLARSAERAAEYRERALAEFGLALAASPHDPETTRQIGETYRRAGRLADARECFEWLARRDPAQWLHAYRLGTLQLEMGEVEAARESLQRAIELDPGQGDAYLALGVALLRAGRPDLATATLEQGAIRTPFHPAIHTNLGVARARSGDEAGGRAAFERALELGTFPLPRLHLTHTNLALLELRAGGRERARLSLERALTVFPDYPLARAWLTRLDDPAPARIPDPAELAIDGQLEIFGEVTTVGFADE